MTQSGQGGEQQLPAGRPAHEGVVLPSDGGAPGCRGRPPAARPTRAPGSRPDRPCPRAGSRGVSPGGRSPTPRSSRAGRYRADRYRVGRRRGRTATRSPSSRSSTPSRCRPRRDRTSRTAARGSCRSRTGRGRRGVPAAAAAPAAAALRPVPAAPAVPLPAGPPAAVAPAAPAVRPAAAAGGHARRGRRRHAVHRAGRGPAPGGDADATQYIPPVPGGAPYGIRPGAPEERQPPSEFDNLFRAEAPADATQQLPPQRYDQPPHQGYRSGPQQPQHGHPGGQLPPRAPQGHQSGLQEFRGNDGAAEPPPYDDGGDPRAGAGPMCR